MKRTRTTTTTTSDGSHKKPRSSMQVTTTARFTDEEYATCLKVLKQVNATTPEMSEILDEPSLELLQTHAVNVIRKMSLSKQWVLSSAVSSFLHWNGVTTNPQTIAVLESNRDDAFHYDVETSRLDLVQEVWMHEIIPFFNVKELAMLRPTCKWCEEQWQEFLKRNTFRVPEQYTCCNNKSTRASTTRRYTPYLYKIYLLVPKSVWVPVYIIIQIIL